MERGNLLSFPFDSEGKNKKKNVSQFVFCEFCTVFDRS